MVAHEVYLLRKTVEAAFSKGVKIDKTLSDDFLLENVIKRGRKKLHESRKSYKTRREFDTAMAKMKWLGAVGLSVPEDGKSHGPA